MMEVDLRERNDQYSIYPVSYRLYYRLPVICKQNLYLLEHSNYPFHQGIIRFLLWKLEFVYRP